MDTNDLPLAEDSSLLKLQEENAALHRELLEQKIILARLDEAISSARGVALTKELAKAYIALDDINPAGWLGEQFKEVRTGELERVLALAVENSANPATIAAIRSRIATVTEYYEVVYFP